jgi:ATP-dependent Clp protease ATP-binding subunit ClpA
MTKKPKSRRNPGGGRPRKPKTPLPPRSTSAAVFDAQPGLPAAIQRLRQAEIRAASDYQLALSTGDVDLIAQQKKAWLDFTEQLRKVESSNPTIQRENAETLPVALVEQETSRMVTAFRVSLENLPRSLPARLIGQDEVAIQETLATAINDALGQLHTKEWSQ